MRPLPQSSRRALQTLASAVFAFCVTTSTPVSAQPPAADTDASASAANWSDPEDLLKDELKNRWQHFSSVAKTPMPGVWQRIDGTDENGTELICTGNPRGFLYTTQQFGDFELNLEWRYASDPNGNSGILVHTQNDQRLWPTSIQVQLHQPEAGSVFPSGDAVTDATVRKEGLARPVGQWNQCRIVSLEGRIVVHINGKKAAEVTGCKPARGCIAIQSEGSEVRFRKITVRTPAKPADKPSEETPDADAESDSSPAAEN